jgi:hypothetical protein
MNQKIFVIGFNKCGTTSLNRLFKSCNINSVHKSGLNSQDILELASKYDAITDGIHYNFQDYYDKYPNSLFILNTRPIYKWLLSRYKHHSRLYNNNKNYQSWCWPASIERTNEWIKTRRQHYKNVKYFFKDKPGQLKIVNIENPGWENKVLRFIKKQKYIEIFKNVNFHKNKTGHLEVKKKIYRRIDTIVKESLKQNNINPNEI